MGTLAGTYQNFRPSENPEQLQAYAAAIERMVGEFGQGRTSSAIQRACDLVPDFVPTPAKIREFMPARQGELKTCTLCHPSGFVMVYQGRTDGGNKIDPKFGAVTRCDHSGGLSPITESHDGERDYGYQDVRYLSHIHGKARKINGNQPLNQKQLDTLLDGLDAAIDAQERNGAKNGRS